VTEPVLDGVPHISVPIPVRWADFDANGHVNNAAYGTLFEEARIQVFWHDDVPGVQADPAGWRMRELVAQATGGPQEEISTFVAKQTIEYLRPIDHARHPVTVELWISRLSGAIVDVSYLMRDGDTIYAKAITSLVVVDRVTGEPRHVPRDLRAELKPYIDEPVTFRR
jgi:acyl-CoA thioester hydrolase